MVANMEVPVMLGSGGDSWAEDQEKVLSTNDTSVTFDIPTNTGYGYKLFIDMSTSANPDDYRPIYQRGSMDFSVSGKCTITFTGPISTRQDGAKAKLRIFK